MNCTAYEETVWRGNKKIKKIKGRRGKEVKSFRKINEASGMVLMNKCWLRNTKCHCHSIKLCCSTGQ